MVGLFAIDLDRVWETKHHYNVSKNNREFVYAGTKRVVFNDPDFITENHEFLEANRIHLDKELNLFNWFSTTRVKMFESKNITKRKLFDSSDNNVLITKSDCGNVKNIQELCDFWRGCTIKPCISTI